MTLARCQLVIQDESGNIVDGASVTVQAELPGAPLVQLYSDRDGAMPIGNPFTAADGADAGFHAAGGSFKITATKDAFTRVWRYVAIGTAQEADGNGFTPRGAYNHGSPGTQYRMLDIVTDQDSSWLYINATPSTGNPPPTLPTQVNSYWQLLSAAAADGIDGTSLMTRVRVVATTNVVIASALENGDSLDGVTLATNDLVLLTGQSTAAENGIYTVPASGAASRTTAFNTYNSMPGILVSAMEGTAGADTLWLCTSNKGGTINSTALAFSRLVDPNAWTAYTPTVTSNTGTITTLGTVTGRYKLTGKTCRVQLRIDITTNGTGAGYVDATLPFTPAAFDYFLQGQELNSTGDIISGHVVPSSAHVAITYYAGAYPGANGVKLCLSGSYEIA